MVLEGDAVWGASTGAHKPPHRGRQSRGLDPSRQDRPSQDSGEARASAFTPVLSGHREGAFVAAEGWTGAYFQHLFTRCVTFKYLDTGILSP